MPLIACPSCDEDDRLIGERRAGGGVAITCEVCGTSWERTDRRCGLCGSNDLEYTPKALSHRIDQA